jgi:predicted GNAT family acetyltransferase
VSSEFSHEPDARRYVLRIDGELVAVVDYVVLGKSISFTHTYTAPHRRGHGYAAEVVEFAVNDVEASGDVRIVPMCWYVGEWFEKHPERAGLLTR